MENDSPDQAGHHVDGLARGLGPLEGYVDQRPVVYDAGSGQLLAASPCAFGYDKPMLVDVADGRIGVGHLGNLAETLVGVPFDHRAHGPSGVVGGRLAVKLAVKVVGVGGVGHHHRPVGCRPFGGDQAGAGLGAERRARHDGGRQGGSVDQSCGNVHIIVLRFVWGHGQRPFLQIYEISPGDSKKISPGIETFREKGVIFVG